MKPNHTDITIVLDRSGSMNTVAEDTIGGFNRFLKDQQEAPGTASDDVFETPIPTSDVKKARPLTSRSFVPRGGTALLDAIGRGINTTGQRLESAPEKVRPEKVVFVIITDGQENSSHEFTREKIDEMIRHQRDKYAWEFVFLGANQDAIATAAGMGIHTANAMSYAANSAGTTSAFHSTSKNLVGLRSHTADTMAYGAKDRAAQDEAGV